MAQLRSLQLITCNQLKMLQFASDILNIETFNHNGFCGFYLGELRVILVEMRGYQHTKSLDVDFEIELSADDCVQDLVARVNFNDYRNNEVKKSDNTFHESQSFYQLTDVDQRIWRVHNFANFSCNLTSQQISNVRMF
jgi:hypothetical protein